MQRVKEMLLCGELLLKKMYGNGLSKKWYGDTIKKARANHHKGMASPIFSFNYSPEIYSE